MKISERTAVRLLIIINLVAALTVVSLHVYAVNQACRKSIPKATKSLTAPSEAFPFITAAISVCVSCLAAGMALSAVAKAGFAAAAERPELKTYIMILGGLAEGIAIYGLLIAVMILGKI
ncbi:MAG: ATPase [Thermoprotei archaeon]|nr:MAG: ATPase [Thermoprotei archaeon]RLE99917.1 MAG: ATPase [Thermoprotei archaeon]